MLSDLKALVEPSTRGDPMQPLLWTSLSLRNLVKRVGREGTQGFCLRWSASFCTELGYSLQAEQQRQGRRPTHRSRRAIPLHQRPGQERSWRADEPVISVDTKKKELVGNFKNNGREWRPQGQPELVNVHDFIDPKLRPRRALWRLRHHQQSGLGERRHRSRHRQLCRQCDPPLVEDHGQEAPSRSRPS